jgi:hypothetical protein
MNSIITKIRQTITPEPEQTVEMKAVYESDKQEFLTSIDELERIKNNSITCMDCGKEITVENIGVIKGGDPVQYSCDELGCQY